MTCKTHCNKCLASQTASQGRSPAKKIRFSGLEKRGTNARTGGGEALFFSVRPKHKKVKEFGPNCRLAARGAVSGNGLVCIFLSGASV